MLFPEFEQVGVERFAGRGGIDKRRQVVLVHVGLHHEAVHGGRAAERGHAVARDEPQDLVGVEAVEIVGEHACFHKPLAVVLAPDGLAPAGVGDGEMKAAVAYDVVPMLRGRDVREGVLGVVQHHLRVAARAAREVHEHGLGRLRLAAGEVFGRFADAGVEVKPASALGRSCAHAVGAGELCAERAAVLREGLAVLSEFRQAAAGAVHEHLHLQRGAGILHGFHHVSDLAAVGADDGFDLSAVQAIVQVVLFEHERGRHHDGAQLCKRGRHEPELVVTAQDHHDHVAMADSVLSDQRFISPKVKKCSSPSGLHQTMAGRSGSASAMSSTTS